MLLIVNQVIVILLGCYHIRKIQDSHEHHILKIYFSGDFFGKVQTRRLSQIKPSQYLRSPYINDARIVKDKECDMKKTASYKMNVSDYVSFFNTCA